MGAYCLVALALVAAFSRRGGAAAAKVETAPAWLAAYEPDPVRVSREAYLNESASALKAAKPIWSSVVADCVLDVGDGAPAHAKLRAGNESPPLEAVAPAPRLCRVVSTIGGDDFDADLVAVFSIVDSLDYLKRPDNWAAFLNKVAFCAKQKRRLYLWVGDIEKAVLHARPGPLPWMDCNEAPGNTLNIYKAVALLALFKKARPRVKAALYLDADAWFTDVAFSETDGATVEAYMALSADADLFGNQNRVGGPKIIFNGGLMMARNTNWVSHFAALWWRARCGAHDQCVGRRMMIGSNAENVGCRSGRLYMLPGPRRRSRCSWTAARSAITTGRTFSF
ncbi:hypothetical protein M885DRAFT_526907 [Pelagophyceae sp. CCMP2097]|nr:hypothetical protein M885DRAFT_526907 [Pelagophyceae sp. CCMP2097]